MSYDFNPKDQRDKSESVNVAEVLIRRLVNIVLLGAEIQVRSLNPSDPKSRRSVLIVRKRHQQLFAKLTVRIQGNNSQPPLSGLAELTDWVPSKATRKQQRKLIADETAEILAFREQGRFWVARWRTMWCWVHWGRYLLSAPLSAAVKALLKSASP